VSPSVHLPLWLLLTFALTPPRRNRAEVGLCVHIDGNCRGYFIGKDSLFLSVYPLEDIARCFMYSRN
jgi:hypothetical protein